MSAPRGRQSLACGIVLAAAVLLLTWAAAAAPAKRSLVVLVLPEIPDTDLAEAYVRVQGELYAAGFEVKSTVGRLDLEPGGALALAAEELDPAAVIGIFENPDGALELWILDARSGRSTPKRLARAGDPARAPEILAISAVELLLAGLSELDIKPAAEADEKSAVPPPPPPPPIAPAGRAGELDRQSEQQRERPVRFGLELGMASAASVDGAGVAWLFAARLAWAPLPILRARLSGLGLGTHPEVEGPGGAARTSQAFVLTEVVLRPWAHAEISPHWSLGSGAHYFAIEGQGSQGAVGRSSSHWSAAVDAGAGLSWRLQQELELSFEAHALLAHPYPSIRFSGAEQATAGRPTLIFTATIAGWL